MIEVIASIYYYIWYAIVFAITLAILLMLVRYILNSLDVNPFTWHAMMTRRLSDPLINPVKRGLSNVGVPAKYAPLITILLVILFGWFALSLVEGLLSTITGVLISAKAGNIIRVIGHLLYGLLSLYALMIFVRIVFSYGILSYRNRLMRFLIKATDPLLVPLRRMIPPVGMFDISPMVAFIIVWLLQAAVHGTLLR